MTTDGENELSGEEYLDKLQKELVTTRLSKEAWIREWQKERELSDALRDSLLSACGWPGGLILTPDAQKTLDRYDSLRR